jgi:hypothetical protein
MLAPQRSEQDGEESNSCAGARVAMVAVHGRVRTWYAGPALVSSGAGVWPNLQACTLEQNDSHFCRGLVRIKDEVLSNGSFVVKDGTNTRFWDDMWIGDKLLKDTYPSLYHIARGKHVTVSKVLSSKPLTFISGGL